MTRSAHIDSFAREHLPPREQWPEFRFDLPELQFPEQLNCASELLDRWVRDGEGERLCIQGAGVRWTYAQLQAQVNRIARVLVDELGIVPGNRVLLRGANSPMLAACWFAVVKAGAIAVGSMPLLRAKELAQIVNKAQVGGHFLDVVEGLPTLKVFNRAKAQAATVREVTEAHRKATMGTLRVAFLSALVLELLATLAVALVAVEVGLRLLAGACAACSSRRQVHRQSAARLHLRPRRLAAVSAVDRRVDGAARKSFARCVAAGDRAIPRERVLHRADRIPRDGCDGRWSRHFVAAQMRQRRRGAGERDDQQTVSFRPGEATAPRKADRSLADQDTISPVGLP